MERLLVEFARHANRDRYRLRFFSLTDMGRPGEDIASCGWPVQCLGKPSRFRLGTVLQIAGLLRSQKIRVVHTHNSGAMIYGALAARIARAGAVIHTRHGQRFGASRGQTLRFAWTARLVDRVVGVSEDTARQCLSDGIAAKRVRMIRNGIDLTRFTPTEHPADGPAVLVARLAPEKDLPNLMQAAAILTGQDPSFRLLIAGSGPCFEETRQSIGQLGLTRHVELLGERSDIPAILARSSLFVLSSKTEGISLTLLEAMACGLPVVATRAGGNGEVVQDGQTGWIVPVGDPGQLAIAIQRLRRDPIEAKRFGAAGRSRVESEFNVLRMVLEYERLYEEVLGRGGTKQDQLKESPPC
jgi:glycosyltransferase involved in cell wall biosynthesis